MTKVDVIIQVYGKPWQTLCTLKSLMKYNSDFIDFIYFIEESEQPYGDSVKWVLKEFDNIIHIMPPRYEFWATNKNPRYQLGIEKSDKNWVFISHNDVLYTDSVIKNMLELTHKNVGGIGEIGQCWNCPAKSLCKGGKNWNTWNPSFEEINSLKLPHIRTHRKDLNPSFPKLMPECRLNEWSCLIKRELLLSSPYFGEYNKTDIGIKWFQNTYIRGYEFIDYRKDFNHMYWSNEAGYTTQLDLEKYKNSEKIAKQYYFKHFKKEEQNEPL